MCSDRGDCRPAARRLQVLQARRQPRPRWPRRPQGQDRSRDSKDRGSGEGQARGLQVPTQWPADVRLHIGNHGASQGCNDQTLKVPSSLSRGTFKSCRRQFYPRTLHRYWHTWLLVPIPFSGSCWWATPSSECVDWTGTRRSSTPCCPCTTAAPAGSWVAPAAWKVTGPLKIFLKLTFHLSLSLLYMAGITMVCRKKFSASNFWRDCTEHKVTVSLQYDSDFALLPPRNMKQMPTYVLAKICSKGSQE